jgi:hypothetical protein
MTQAVNVSAAPPPPEGDGSAQHIELLGALHRLLKMTRIYEDSNQALMGAADTLASANLALCQAERVPATDVMFASETAFVNGRMLRLSREVYGRTMDLADLLDEAGVSAVTLPSSTTAADALVFARTAILAREDEAKQRALTDKAGVRGIRSRKLRRLFGGQAAEGDRSPTGRVVRTYACTVVLLRRVFAEYGSGRLERLPPGLTRVAQRIVGHSEDEPALLVALASAPTRESDEAAVSASTALVAALMARQLTKDRSLLASITHAALIYHLGQTRVLSGRSAESKLAAVPSPLREDERDRLAASTVAAIASLDKLDAANARRAVIAFEGHWQRRMGKLGPVYRGSRTPTVLGRILAVARTFAELMAPSPYAAPMGPADAIQFLDSKAESENDRTYVKLLTGGLGIFPVGTMVELSTGEVGVVLRVPDSPAYFSRPPLRVLYDAAGDACATPVDVDLSSPDEWGATQRVIRRAVDADAQQTQAMRAYVLSITRDSSSVRREARASSPEDSARRAAAAAPARDVRPPSAEDSARRAAVTMPVPVQAPPSVETLANPFALTPLFDASPSSPPVREATPAPRSPTSSGALVPSPPSSGAMAAPPSSGVSSTTGRRRRSLADRPKVFDPRAEPDTASPSVERLSAPVSWSAPRSPTNPGTTPATPPVAPPAASPRSAPAATPSASSQPNLNTTPTRPAMKAVTASARPTLPEIAAEASVHERRTEPPVLEPVLEPRLVEGDGDEPPILELPPLDDAPEAEPAHESSGAVTRAIGWHDVASELMAESEPAPPTPRPTGDDELDWGALTAEEPPAPEQRPPPGVAKSTVAGTRKANWHEYGQLVKQAAPKPTSAAPSGGKLNPDAYDSITDDDEPEDKP